MTKKFLYSKPFTVLMSICMFFISVLIPLKSASAEVIHREKYEIAWAYSPQYGKDVRTDLLKNANGHIAYCLVYGKKSPDGQDLPEIGRTDDVVYRVLLNGYPQKTPEQLGVSTWQQAHYATQLSVWVALGQLQPDDLQFKDGEVERAVKAIRYAADHTEDTQDVFMNVKPTDKQEAKLNGAYFETTQYTVESNAKQGTYQVALNQAPVGTRIVTEQGEAKETFSLGETFRVQVPKSSKSAELSLKVTANLTNQHAVVYKGTESIQDATVLLERSQQKVSQDIQVFWKSMGGLEIRKVDENKKPLAGAVFEVLTSDQKSMGTITTNDKGIALLDNMEIGTYVVKEVKSPVGYVLQDTPQTVEIKTGEIATITAENQPIYGELEVTKVDVADGNVKLPHAEFEIRNEKGDMVAKGKTNEQGIAKFKLGYGKYTYKETVSPDGYRLNEETFSFEIKQNGEIVKHTVADEKIPSMQTTAIDKTDGAKEMHTSQSVTIQDKVVYKDLQVGKEYTIQGKLVDKASNQPLVVKGKEVTAASTFTAKEANGSITLDFTFDATGLEEKEVVVFENLTKEGKVVATHSDIEDKGQTVKFVKPSVQTTATNKEDGSKELEAKNAVTIQDKVAYKDFIVGKEYVVKGKLMDKSTNQPFVVDGKEVTAEHMFTAKEKDGFVTVDFTFHASALEGKEVVVFEDVYQNGVLVATHSDIQDKGQTVTFKNRPVQPKPEQPQTPSKTPNVTVQTEQPKVVEHPVKEKPIVKAAEPAPKKVEHKLPTTGGQEENPYWMWIGGIVMLYKLRLIF
ncbi:VaFE repeat-containing surface-anchored protein [Bacillus thuringiensis]|uniref:VaFE repeat-containing surface-anchored protein n=3 Tax=Bacillus cereus group TaxID=86661 RepID=UPI0025A5DB6F|nr:VaFE repeat-containing surface-anchored protein [Bacillus thuringiensis]MDM8365422.1 VaFE repeat-containing surface-anchored protein [Bacillus thuringiensis]